MPGMTSRLADVTVLAAGADPQTGLTASEVTFPMTGPFTAIVTDTALVDIPASRIKSLAINVTTTVTWVTSGQPTVRLFAARTKYGVLGGDTATAVWGTGAWASPTSPFLGATGATSQIPAAPNANASQLIGTAANWGPAAATSLPAGIYWFSPTQLAELQWWYPVLGVEVILPSAQTAGAYQVFMEVSPI